MDQMTDNQYKRFNRHECFTLEMMKMTGQCIDSLWSFYFSRKVNSTKTNIQVADLKNMLFGLYDGYLYDDLLPTALEVEVDAKTEEQIRGLIKAIEVFIKISQ